MRARPTIRGAPSVVAHLSGRGGGAAWSLKLLSTSRGQWAVGKEGTVGNSLITCGSGSLVLAAAATRCLSLAYPKVPAEAGLAQDDLVTAEMTRLETIVR